MRKQHPAIQQFFADLDESFLDDALVAPDRDTDRHFDTAEQDALAPDSRGFLMELYRKRQATRRQMELLIHYAVTFRQSPMGRAELERLLDRLFFAVEEDPDAPDTFPGRPH